MKKEAMFYRKSEGKKTECFLCSHNCKIIPSQFGICGVRENSDGTLYSLVYGELIASNIDPIEKKPLYHFLPGSDSYSIAAIGCNFKCGFCQNWQISQMTKKEKFNTSGGEETEPEKIVRDASAAGCKSISYTYTEPTIYFEYAYDTAKPAKTKGLYNVFVTNGFMSRESIDEIRPYLDAANIDLKSFNDDFYKKNCKARLKPVLDNISYMKESGIWIEITTLLIPDKNDSDEELKGIADFIAGISPDIPWHISRFHPQYKMANGQITPLEALLKAQAIGKRAGLKYIYLGNIARENDTLCPKCNSLLIERKIYTIKQNNIKNGKCAQCGTKIPGIWK